MESRFKAKFRLARHVRQINNESLDLGSGVGRGGGGDVGLFVLLTPSGPISKVKVVFGF